MLLSAIAQAVPIPCGCIFEGMVPPNEGDCEKGKAPVLRFCGFEIELFVDDVLARGDWPAICTARDFAGRHWLIVQVNHDPERLAWMCAPASAQAMQAVRDGSATATDVLRHSATGTVELVTIAGGRAIPDRCIPCASLPGDLSPEIPYSPGK
jgi:hypothetical protein